MVTEITEGVKVSVYGIFSVLRPALTFFLKNSRILHSWWNVKLRKRSLVMEGIVNNILCFVIYSLFFIFVRTMSFVCFLSDKFLIFFRENEVLQEILSATPSIRRKLLNACIAARRVSVLDSSIPLLREKFGIYFFFEVNDDVLIIVWCFFIFLNF